MSVEVGDIRQAAAILTQIMFARGEDSDPAETLRMWRQEEGIAVGAVEEAALSSAEETLGEIGEIIERGGEVSLDLLRDFLRSEYEVAWQLGWICRARRAEERAAVAEAEPETADA